MQARNLSLCNQTWGNKVFESLLHVTSDYSLPTTVNGPTAIKYVNGLIVDEGKILTVSARCKGLVLFVNGDAIINGTVDMTARGATAVGDNLAIDYTKAEFLVNPTNWDDYEYKISAAGGAGGARTGGSKDDATNYNLGHNDGAIGINSSGGGGSGGCFLRKAAGYSGAGSAGTSYSGGAGGGGQARYNASGTGYGGAGGANGGAGGAGNCYTGSGYTVLRKAAGGAGNNGGAGCGGSYVGLNGTGGLLVLVVKGNLYLGSTGIIRSNGSRGGNITSSADVESGGGGSGGGNITVLYSKEYSNQGTIQANGGAGGNADSDGGAGGAGMVAIANVTI